MIGENTAKKERVLGFDSIQFYVNQARFQAAIGGYVDSTSEEKGGEYWERDAWDGYIERMINLLSSSTSFTDAEKTKALADVAAIDAEKKRKNRFRL